ncbi:11311_t:CDS:2 [Paraglomus brasilianum]|uniref:11311_t:CDS:1 n=1 Tax=Paraglomus brasilianum TaxID=144538 RepID=A0A9N9FKY4_9GLOM|nr:11311_t:CDS:2 [Paraglomus brasilianum]
MASSSKDPQVPFNGIPEIDPEVMNEMKSIEEKAADVEKHVAKEYTKLMRPIYEKRRHILAKIPKFWPQTLAKHVLIAQYLQSDDYEIIQYLTDLFVEKHEEKLDDYKIFLHFSTNPFFKNTELVKEYYLDDKGDYCTKSTPIEWHEGKDITQKSGNSSEEESDDISFFAWFTSKQTLANEGWDLGKVISEEIFPKAFE